jgi:hypothetical protein
VLSLTSTSVNMWISTIAREIDFNDEPGWSRTRFRSPGRVEHGRSCPKLSTRGRSSCGAHRRAHLPGHAEVLLMEAEVMLPDDPEEAWPPAYTCAEMYEELAARFPKRYADRLAATQRVVDAIRNA